MTKTCGTCSLCCKLPYVAELNKPIDTWCQHCKPGKGGCTIYADRPAPCVNFTCGWLDDPNIGDEWFPARCKMVLNEKQDGGLLVTVDPAFPNAWRREPYYSQLKAQDVHVEIRIGCRFIDLRTEREVVRSQAWVEGR
jgi:hypothetical protein